MTRNVQTEIKEVIDANAVILFMKGNREMPQCGFSARVVEILNHCDVEYATVDILRDPEVRQGIKVFSNWRRCRSCTSKVSSSAAATS